MQNRIFRGRDSAGKCWKLIEEFRELFLLLNSGTVFEIDFNRMVEFHKQHGRLATLFTHPSLRIRIAVRMISTLIITAVDGAVVNWPVKDDERPKYYKNLVTVGLHVIDPVVLDQSGIGANLTRNTSRWQDNKS